MNSTYGIPGEVLYLNKGNKTFEGSTRWTDFAPHLGVAYKITNKEVARTYTMGHCNRMRGPCRRIPISFMFDALL